MRKCGNVYLIEDGVVYDNLEVVSETSDALAESGIRRVSEA